MSLGERLKNARTKKDYTQEHAANLLGITFQALSNYERGVRDPDPEMLKKMADLYNVSTDWLLGRTNNRSGIHTQAAHMAEDAVLSDEDMAKIEEILAKVRARHKEQNKG